MLDFPKTVTSLKLKKGPSFNETLNYFQIQVEDLNGLWSITTGWKINPGRRSFTKKAKCKQIDIPWIPYSLHLNICDFK